MMRLDTKTNYGNKWAGVRQGEKSQNYRNDIMVTPRNVNKSMIKTTDLYLFILSMDQL